MKHIMVDIETLSTAVNAAVLSIGAVEFDPMSGKIEREFYHELDLSEQANRHIDVNTMQWWVKQCLVNTDNIESVSYTHLATVEGFVNRGRRTVIADGFAVSKLMGVFDDVPKCLKVRVDITDKDGNTSSIVLYNDK